MRGLMLFLSSSTTFLGERAADNLQCLERAVLGGVSVIDESQSQRRNEVRG